MSSRAETLLMQGHQARREQRMDDARRLFVEAVEAARLSSERTWLARAYTGLGQIERDLCETGLALLHYQEAAAIYRRIEEPLHLAHTVRHVGDILREDGQPATASPYYREALEIYRANPETPPLDLANAIRGYALLQEEVAEKQEALALWREARELYAAVNVHAGVAEGDRRIECLSRIASPSYRQ